MTGLLIAGGIAILIGAAIIVTARVRFSHAAPVATALLLGLAGYAWQGSPGQAGNPVQPGAQRVEFDEELAKKRTEIGERISVATRWMVLSDGLARSGNTEAAANVLLSGLREFPEDPNIWVGMGNALMAHGNRVLSPAADYSYRQALRYQPEGVSPNYFYGLALAESGEFARSRAIWSSLADRLPENNELKPELVRNIALLDSLISRRDAMAQGMVSQSGNPAP